MLGEELGALEPCGCIPGMQGGIARRETAIRQIQQKSPNTLVLHNGDLIKSFGTQADLKREAQLQALNRLPVAVMGIGVGEFMLGAGALLRFQRQAAFPLLCANLEDTRQQISFLPEWNTALPLKPAPMTVRVFSLISPSYQRELDLLIPGFKIHPVEKFLDEWAQRKKENEFWVLLFQGPAHEAFTFALRPPPFDLMVFSHTGESPYMQKTGSTQMVSTGAKGRDFLSATFEAAPPYNLRKFDRHPLGSQFAESPEVKAQISKYKLQLKEERLAEKFPRVEFPDENTYAGSESCQKCHQAEYEVWKNSRHARALEKLAAENHDGDPECLLCHSAGFRFRSGFVTREKTPALGNVSCESCHGPRSLHAASPREHRAPPVSRTTCLACHDTENSPTFDFDTYWPKIQHVLNKNQ